MPRVNLHPNVTRTVTLDMEGEKIEVKLTAQIALYSIGEPQLAVDVGEAQERGFPVVSQRIMLRDAKVDTDEAVVTTLNRAIDAALSTRVVRCTRCDGHRLDADDSNRTDVKGRPLCEACFCAELDADFKREAEKEKVREAKAEKKLHAKGYRWAVDMWIHPKNGGDDYQTTVYYTKRPTKETVVAYLKRASSVTTDYTKPRALTP